METNNEARLSDLGAKQAGIEITPTAADPLGLATEALHGPGVSDLNNVTSEEFFAEGTLPLAETTSAPSKKYEPINVERFSEGLYNQRDFVKVDGDRIQMTTDEATVAVDAVLSAQSGYKFDFFRDDLANRVIALEETQTKIIAALKHLGLDTNKHFR